MAAILYVLVAVAFALFALSMHVQRSRSRILVRALGALAVALTAFILVMLIYFRPAACRALHGHWNRGRSCQGEWGGHNI